MKIVETKQGAVTVIKPTGPLTQADATEFKNTAMKALESNLGRILVDVSAIPFVDSMGLEALYDVTEEMTKSGQMLKLCAENKTLREVLNLTGISPLFEHFDDVNTAVRSFL
jgi:anti-sigma B factor antagonist